MRPVGVGDSWSARLAAWLAAAVPEDSGSEFWSMLRSARLSSLLVMASCESAVCTVPHNLSVTKMNPEKETPVQAQGPVKHEVQCQVRNT